MGVLNVSGQIGQKCKSESAGKHSPCSAKHYFGAAQQIGHYTDWTEQIAINNGTLSKQPLFPNPLLLPLHALPVSSSLFLFSLSVSVLVAFLTSVQVLENSSSNVERNVKQQDQTSHPRERWKKRGEEKGGREKRMGGEEAVGGESQTLQQEKTTGIWLFSPSLPPPPPPSQPRGTYVTTLEKDSSHTPKANIMDLSSLWHLIMSRRNALDHHLCVLRTQYNQFQKDLIKIC